MFAKNMSFLPAAAFNGGSKPGFLNILIEKKEFLMHFLNTGWLFGVKKLQM